MGLFWKGKSSVLLAEKYGIAGIIIIPAMDV